MKRTENMSIVVLAITAAILAGLLIGSFVSGSSAIAGESAVKDGDYIMSIGQYNNETDFLYVIDIAAEKLNVYYINLTTGAIALGDSVDLKRAFAPGAP